MSLTSELNNPNSIISRFLNSFIDPVESHVLRHQWNIKLKEAKTLKLNSDVNPSLVGTAFDYLFRWIIAGHFDPHHDELIGMMGAYQARGHQFHVQALAQLIEKGNHTPHLRAAVSIILSFYERIIREGNHQQVDDCFITMPKSVDEAVSMLSIAVPIPEYSDLQQLMATIPAVWGTRLQKPYTLNPILPNSKYVGGADADWIVDGILYDCKCSWRNAPFSQDHLRQVMAYALLDWDNKLNLRGIGWYYARQQMIIEYPLEELIPDIKAKRVALKALYTTSKPELVRNINMDNLNAHLENILWKHHGNQINHVRFPWESEW